MAGPDETQVFKTDQGPVRQRPPWLFGAIAILIGVGLAVAAGTLLSGPAPTASATSTPGATSAASLGLPSALPSPSVAVVASPSPEITAAPTAAPTAVPTAVPTTKPTPTPNTNAAIVTWKVPAREDCTNDSAGSIHVEWSVVRATGVTISIDGPGIYDAYPGTTGSIDIPYGCSITVLSHTYTLRTTGGTGPAATSTKTVTTREGEILSFTMPNEVSCQNPSGSAPTSFSYEIRAATAVQLYRGTEYYGTYQGKAGDSIPVIYDCSKDKVVFHLVTDGGYGAVDEDTETVTRVLAP